MVVVVVVVVVVVFVVVFVVVAVVVVVVDDDDVAVVIIVFIDEVVVVFVLVRVGGGGGGVPGAGTGDIGVDALDWWLVLDTIECSCCHRYCVQFSKCFSRLKHKHKSHPVPPFFFYFQLMNAPTQCSLTTVIRERRARTLSERSIVHVTRDFLEMERTVKIVS